MPELPEIQAHCERLTDQFAEVPLARFRALSFTVMKTVTPPPERAVGRPLDRVDRRGKHLLLRFGDLTFVVHLMQGGRIEPDPKQSAKPRGGHARWVFEDGGALLLTEAGTEKRAGVWVLEGDPLGQPPLDDLGPEADAVDLGTFSAALGATGGRIHGFLRDQRHVAGIGRRLANEVCHRAEVSPFAPCNKLNPQQIEAVWSAMRACIEESLAFERGLTAMSSSAQRPAAVHHRVGQACPTCGDTIRAVSYHAYEVDYCATCQTDGRVLADNTTSRFLK